MESQAVNGIVVLPTNIDSSLSRQYLIDIKCRCCVNCLSYPREGGEHRRTLRDHRALCWLFIVVVVSHTKTNAILKRVRAKRHVDTCSSSTRFHNHQHHDTGWMGSRLRRWRRRSNGFGSRLSMNSLFPSGQSISSKHSRSVCLVRVHISSNRCYMFTS